MKHIGECPKCGGTEIIADAKVVDRGHYLEMILVTYRKPDALIFKAVPTVFAPSVALHQ